VGKEEYGGVPTPTREDTAEPRHWRLEAIAATERPRSLSISSDGRLLVFIQDRGTSDVWLLGLDERVPRRLTTGRQPTPYWEDATPRLSPDGSTVAYVDQGLLWLAPAAGGPARSVLEVADIAWGGPRWLSDNRLVVMNDSGGYTRLMLAAVEDPRPRPLVVDHSGTDDEGDETEPAPSRDGTHVAYTFTPRADLNRSEIRVADVQTGVVRALTGTPQMHDREPVWSSDGAAGTSCISSASTERAIGSSPRTERTFRSTTGIRTAVDWLPHADGQAVSISSSWTRARERWSSSHPEAAGALRTGRRTARSSRCTRIR